MKKNNDSLILDTVTERKKYKISNLTPYTTYLVSVAGHIKYRFGQETFTSFVTAEEGKC